MRKAAAPESAPLTDNSSNMKEEKRKTKVFHYYTTATKKKPLKKRNKLFDLVPRSQENIGLPLSGQHNQRAAGKSSVSHTSW